MNGDTAAALRQVRLALQRLLGPRLQLGSPEEATERRAKAATAANGNQPANAAAGDDYPTAARSDAKASSG